MCSFPTRTISQKMAQEVPARATDRANNGCQHHGREDRHRPSKGPGVEDPSCQCPTEKEPPRKEGQEYRKVKGQIATARPLSDLRFRHTVVVADSSEQHRHARISCLGPLRASDAARVRIGVTDSKILHQIRIVAKVRLMRSIGHVNLKRCVVNPLTIRIDSLSAAACDREAEQRDR
jgi:hypothetical protein